MVALASLVFLGLRAAGVGGLVPPVAAVVLALVAGRHVPAARPVTIWAATLAVAVATGLLWQLAMVLALGAYAALARGIRTEAEGSGPTRSRSSILRTSPARKRRSAAPRPRPDERRRQSGGIDRSGRPPSPEVARSRRVARCSRWRSPR